MHKTNRLQRFFFAVAAAIMAFFPARSHALDETLVEFFSAKVIEHSCSDRGEWLRCYQLKPAACSSAMESVVRPCANQILEPLTVLTSDKDEAMKTALAFQKCFNTKFEKIFAHKRLDTSECQKGPAHLKDSKKQS